MRNWKFGMPGDAHRIETVEQLERLYGEPRRVAVLKEVEEITPSYAKLIETAPFVVIATSGPEGLDCSPKGDPAGFVHILDKKTLAIPDRPGNNRIDGMRNLVRDPRIALLFLIPGVGETLRANGRAQISVEPQQLQSFAIGGKLPRSVILVRSSASTSIARKPLCGRSCGARARKLIARACRRSAQSSPN